MEATPVRRFIQNVLAVAVLLLAADSTHGQGRNVQLVWVDRTGIQVETLGTPAGFNGLDVSPDGARVAVHRNDGDGGDIWIFESDQDAVSRLTSNAGGGLNNSMPVWSPDGTRIAFGAFRNGRFGLYVKRADGVEDEERLLETDDRVIPMSWSPDGRFIVYWGEGFTQWVLPLAGGQAPFRLLENFNLHGQISPDGNWIAYTAAGEIYVTSFPAGSDVWQVSTTGGAFPRWRADGQELFFMSGGPSGYITAADIDVDGSTVQPGPPRVLFDSGHHFEGGRSLGPRHPYAVSPNGQRFLIPRPEPDTLMAFDRQGDVSNTVDRDIYSLPAFAPSFPAYSPDGTQLAVIKGGDVWVLDVATGDGSPITSRVHPLDRVQAVVWSPSGSHVAYLVRGPDGERLYRTASRGGDPADLLYRLPGANASLNDWSRDGRFLVYYTPQLGGNVLFALPLDDEREPIEIARSVSEMRGARLSPDGRFLAYRSNESGRDEIWVQPFSHSEGPGLGAWQVSTDGGLGLVSWRDDGRELYYLAPDRGVMALDVETAPRVAFGMPRRLFTAPAAIPTTREPVGSISRSGNQLLFAVPPTSLPRPLNQITLFDRNGGVLRTVGEPGLYASAALSPDGTRVAAARTDLATERSDIWSFDVATGASVQVTDDTAPDFGPIWSPDGSHILYVSERRGGYQGIYRRAWDGSGSEDLLFRYLPGAPVTLSDVSPDGDFVTFTSGGVMLVVPLTGTDSESRQAIEFTREEFFTGFGRFSPDGRFMAYTSDESGRFEVYVRPFEAASAAAAVEGKWQVSNDGAGGMIFWRGDGQEMYFVNAGQQVVMAVDVASAPEFRPDTPHLLFRLPGLQAGGLVGGNVSRDGQRLAFIMPVTAGSPEP